MIFNGGTTQQEEGKRNCDGIDNWENEGKVNE
jgi:hypothetical protein